MQKLLFSIAFLALLTACQKEEISLSTNADEVFYLENNKAAMPIRVHGNTASKTFIMMIHGGPGGDAVIYRSEYVKSHVEPKYAMVYWDQRNGGASQGSLNGSFDELQYFVEDFEKVITLLKYRYGDDISIFVNGHSWGGFLTPAFLQKGDNQHLVKGWIQSAGAHNIPLLNKYAVEMLLDKANIEIAADRHVAKWTEIRDYCQRLNLPLTLNEAVKINQYTFQAQEMTPEIPQAAIGFGEAFDIYLENDFPIQQLIITTNPVTASLANWLFGGQQISDGMAHITIPTLLLFGKWDFTCPPKLADDIEERVQSAYIKKVIFENSGHNVMSGADREAYWEEVMEFVEAFR